MKQLELQAKGGEDVAGVDEETEREPIGRTAAAVRKGILYSKKTVNLDEEVK